MEKASTDSAPPYPGPPMNYPGPSHPSAPVLSPVDSTIHETAPPYPGPPSNYPGAPPAQFGHPGGVYNAPMTTLRGPPYAAPPMTYMDTAGKGYTMNEPAPPYPEPMMHYPPGGPQPAMYPPPHGVHPGGPAYSPVPTTTVVLQAPTPVITTTVVVSGLQDVPGHALCPHCQQSVITRIEHTAGTMAWLICAGLCLAGCGFCSCIPFCLESCQDVEHHCPNCQRVIYIYKRMK